MKSLIVFDLDGTITESKSAVDAEMSALLRDLLDIAKVAVISGGDWPQFERQLLSNLPRYTNLAHLSLLPTCGTKFYKSFILRTSPLSRETGSSVRWKRCSKCQISTPTTCGDGRLKTEGGRLRFLQ